MSLIIHGFECSNCGYATPLHEVRIFGYNIKQILEMEKFWVAHNLEPPKGGEEQATQQILEPIPKDLIQDLEIWKL